jgi:RecA-family ATPase
MRTYFKQVDFVEMVSTEVSLNGTYEWKPDWMAKMLIQRQAFNILGGAQKVGKSLLRTHLLVCAVANRPALDCYEVKPAKRALLLAGEEMQEVEEARIRRAARALDVEDSSLPIDIIEQRHGFFFDDFKSFDGFLEFVESEGYDLVVIDPLVRWHRANENATGELAPILTNLRLLTRFATLLLVHHTGKPSKDHADYALGHLLRGSSDLAAIYDHLLVLKKRKGSNKFTREILIDTRHEEQPDPIVTEFQFGEEEYKLVAYTPTVRLVRFSLGRTGQSATAIRDSIKRRKEDVLQALQLLELEGFAEQTPDGWTRKPVRISDH